MFKIMRKIPCTQYAIIEFHNCAPYIQKFVSDKKIATLEDFDEERDAITFVDFPTTENI